jgi:multimeric flavodoxin WrbA
MNPVIIVGSSRKDGDTEAVIKKLSEMSGWDVINLSDYAFGFYDYDHNNRMDDYLPLMTDILDQYDTLIFATPVYWYSMSAIMKTFFDRITDLFTIKKDLGRKLRGKNMAALSCSHGNNLGDAFWLPFSESANYLGMNYLGNMHIITGESFDEKILGFIEMIEMIEKDL